jgi:hypothetical protein
MKKLTLMIVLASIVSAADAGENSSRSKQTDGAHDYELNIFAVQTVVASRQTCSNAVGKKRDVCEDLEFDRAAMRVSAVSELIPKGKTPHEFAVETYHRLVRLNGELANTP